MKQVIVFPRGQLTSRDKERLSKADVVAVEADDPSKVVSILPTGGVVGADDMLMAALRAVCGGFDSVGMAFVKELFLRAQENERARKGEHK
jgi:hypothetical protein